MQHDPRLDGLRGIAIGLVVLSHGGHRLPLDGLAGAVYRAVVDVGWAGVDLFFVLSGFLITRILLRTREQPAYLRNFYARRTLRIFPAYYLWLVFVLVVVPRIPFFDPFHLEIRAGASALWYWLYASNFAVAFHGIWLHPTLSLAWSLAIEEQFYLVWPWVVRAATPGRIIGICIGCMLAAPLLRTVLLLAGVTPLAAFVLTPCRFDALAVGALIATVSSREGGVALLLGAARRLAPPCAIAVVGLIVAVQAGWVAPGPRAGLAHQPLMATAGYSLLALLFGCALVFAAFGSEARTGFLRFRPLRVLGRYSYAMYLTHTFVGGLVAVTLWNPLEHPGWLGALASYALEWSAQLAAAMLSWYAVESHFLRWKSRFA